MTVRAVVVIHSGKAVAGVYDALSALPPGGVEAALAYYTANRVAIDRRIEAGEAAHWR